jgi:ABC-2 type transport system ATP-binding protein
MIEVNNLSRYYGHTAILQDVTFSAAVGEIVGLLGLNGAGKTTLMRTIVGDLKPSDGTITVNGTDINDMTTADRAQFGFLPETPPQYENMTTRAFLRHLGALRGMTEAQLDEGITRVVALANLEGRESQVIATLSHGYQKRLGVAATILHNPKVVLLDEPISGLDPVQIVEMRSVIKDLSKQCAVVVSSHILTEIALTCDRVVVLDNGRVIATGTPEALTAQLGADRLTLTVRGAIGDFTTWLTNHTSVSTVLSSHESTPFSTATVQLDSDSRESLLKDLTAVFGLRSVHTPDDDLEELFIELTKTTPEAS